MTHKWYANSIEAAKRLRKAPVVKKTQPISNPTNDIKELVNPAGHKGPKGHQNREKWEAPSVTNPLSTAVFRSTSYNPLADYYARSYYMVKKAQMEPMMPMGGDPTSGVGAPPTGGGGAMGGAPQGPPVAPMKEKKDSENPDYVWKFNVPLQAQIGGSVAGGVDQSDNAEGKREKIEVYQDGTTKKYMIKTPEGKRIFLGKDLKHVMHFIKSKWDTGMQDYLTGIEDMPRFTG